jgi:hypothetical protein
MDSDASTQTVFYSWQSDLENRTNRGFIQEALQKAIDAVLETELAMDLVLDRDTQNTVGAPDIAKTILDKIDRAVVVVADVSIVNSGSSGRLTPNPNVLFELGYAVRALSWDYVLPVFNLATGRIEDLPFDLRSRRPVTYKMPNDEVEKKDELKKLARTLQAGIQGILELQRKKQTILEFVFQSTPNQRFGLKNLGVTPIEIVKFSIEYPKSIDVNSYPAAGYQPFVSVEESCFEDGTPTWKLILLKTDAPLPYGYPDKWRIPPQIDAGETEIFRQPAIGFKENAPAESIIKLHLSLAAGSPIKKIVTLGCLTNAEKPLTIL